MKTADLIQILNGDIGLIDKVNPTDNANLKDYVLVTTKHVENMLKKFLQNEITDSDLAKWANFIRLLSMLNWYSTVRSDIDLYDEKHDEISDYYEDVLEVIIDLSNSHFDRKIDIVSVNEYLQILEKYKNDKYASFNPLVVMSAEDILEGPL